jgi:trehalose 6-phosphate synthase/phosphatase
MSHGSDRFQASRVLIVSNRLPVTIRYDAEGVLNIERSSGGLATALSRTHSERDSLWIGWPGTHFRSPAIRRRVEQTLREDYRCIPVFLSAQAIQRYYYGFSNRTLWPLFHSFQSYMAYDEKEWEAYVQANRTFCDVILQEARPDDLIWVHDYHLFLVPGMVRQYLPEACIGFFLHTPFPSSEMFRVLPCREALVRGLLGADVIGFQTFSFMQNFFWAVYRILGIDAEAGSLHFAGRQVSAAVHPIAVDPEQFLQAIHEDPNTIAELARLEESLGARKLILGMDRLDYSKGIPARLRAYRRLLDTHAEWRERVCFIQVAVPSREKVLAYQELKREVDGLVGEINGVFGTTTWTPVQYVHRNLPFPEICALLRRADVALITPLRDGMNLVAKEYVACQEKRPGALILSEFAGAASEMGEAFSVNPYDEAGMAERLHEVLSLPEDVLQERMAALHKRIRTHTVAAWAETFLASMTTVRHTEHTRALTPRDWQHVRHAYGSATRRVLLFGYDGTLTPLVKLRNRAIPSHDLLHVLHALQNDPANLVAVISGRDRTTLTDWLGSSGCTLVAEHGVWIREAPSAQWRMLTPGLRNDWKETVLPVLEQLVEQTPGSLLEEKEFSLAWHYRMADPEFGLWQARELHNQLQSMLAGTGLQVQSGNKVVEVKWAEVNKGLAATYIIDRAWPVDFILAVGDDRTDEDLFAAVPADQWTIKVGTGYSTARFSLSTPDDVLHLLQDFLALPVSQT